MQPDPAEIQQKTSFLRQKTRDHLGAEAIDVELTDEQIDNCIRRALQLYNKYIPLVRHRSVDISGQENFVVDFSTEEWSHVRKVITVNFKDRTDLRPDLHGSIAVESDYAYGRGVRPGRFVKEYTQGVQRQRYFTGTQSDWYWDEDNRKLLISCPSQRSFANIQYTQTRDLTHITPDKEYDFERLVIAYCKQIIARVIGRFGEIPGPNGAIPNDSDALKSEASETIEEITNSLKGNMTSSPPPGYIG